jgi:hypothetical protein
VVVVFYLVVWVCGKVALVCGVEEGYVLPREGGRDMDQDRITGHQMDAINRREVCEEFEESRWGEAWFKGRWVEDDHDSISGVQELALRERKAVVLQKAVDDPALSIRALTGEELGRVGICIMVCLVVVEDIKFWRDSKKEGVNSAGLRVGVGQENVSPLGSRCSQKLFSIKVDQRRDAVQKGGMAG